MNTGMVMVTHNNNFTSTTQFRKHSSVVGRRLENLILSDDDTPTTSSGSTNHQTNGSQQPPSFSSPAHIGVAPVLSPPPAHSRGSRSNNHGRITNQNVHQSNTVQTSPKQTDPFGMKAFNPNEQELMDIQAGFSQGLTFGTDDFSVEDFDPLNQRL